MSSSSDKMIAQFSNFEDLQAFAKAQQKTLVDLSKKNKSLDEEVKHLKKLLEGAVPVINAPAKIDFTANDEEAIAREQLYLLKKISSEKELNLEETKRVEIYAKILIALRSKEPKDINGKFKDQSQDELMAVLNQSENDDGRDDQH